MLFLSPQVNSFPYPLFKSDIHYNQVLKQSKEHSRSTVWSPRSISIRISLYKNWGQQNKEKMSGRQQRTPLRLSFRYEDVIWSHIWFLQSPSPPSHIIPPCQLLGRRSCGDIYINRDNSTFRASLISPTKPSAHNISAPFATSGLSTAFKYHACLFMTHTKPQLPTLRNHRVKVNQSQHQIRPKIDARDASLLMGSIN
jgi:hypothetical protein